MPHVLALLSALKQNMQVLQSSVIDVQFVNILYLSSPESVRQSVTQCTAVTVDIEGEKKKRGLILYICFVYSSFFRSSIGETTSATSQCQSLSKALEEKLIQGNTL